MEVISPATLSDALALAFVDDSRLCAGGTALQLDWAKGLQKPARLVDLSRIGDLKGIQATNGVITIGAMTTLAALVDDTRIVVLCPLLHEALGKVAGPTVRNRATLGGNIATRSGCLLPALLVLDATLVIETATGRVQTALVTWLSAPKEDGIVTEIRLRCQDQGERWAFRKIGLRAAFTPSVINVAARLALDEGGNVAHAPLAVGGGIVPPARLSEAEASLQGAPFADIDWSALRQSLRETIATPDDAFRSANYRKRVAANAIVHSLGGSFAGRKTFPNSRLPDPMPAPDGTFELARANRPENWHIRPDIETKVSGTLEYLTDARGTDMLVGRILRAGVPHARIVSIDTSKAEALAGVAAVVTHRDIPGLNAFGIVIQDQPALCFDKVRHRGDPIAAVAAVDAETAEAALSLIRVEYEALPLVDEPEAALRPETAKVHDEGNLQCELHFARGDIEVGFASATHIIEETYVAPRQMHGFMETEGGHAFIDEAGVLNVLAGGQHGGRDRMQLARILALPQERIRVVTSPTGGAFGGKDELSVQPVLALLALKTRRRVRLQLSRAESVLAGQKRNPMTIRMRTGINADGRLTAQQVKVIADAGAYASLGPGVLETALEHAAGPYIVENVRTHGRLAYTNNGLCGAFRGFGANQMTYAVECQMDRLAHLAGLSPIEIRRRNLRKPGMPGYLGQSVAPTERSEEMLAAAANSDLWTKLQGQAVDV
jgi:xanthine dehydrogenase C subunit